MEKPAHSPISQSRNVNIGRSQMNMKSRSPSSGFRDDYRRSMPLNHGSSSIIATTGVNSILQGRSREKKDMQELNQRFGSYIEKVRFLEAQNRKLATELTTLRERWGQETEKIKVLYDGEMKQLRKLLDESEKDKAELQVRVTSVEDQLSESQIQLNDAKQQEKVDQETIDKLNQTITENEGEINILRKRISRFDDERARDRKEIERLRKEVLRLRQELDQETLAHINAENDCQTAQEELEFQKQVHESELKELASLAYRDTTAENRDYWKTELSQAIHDMQSEYDNKLEIMKNEMDSVYSVKMSEMRNSSSRGSLEFTHLKDENGRIKAQLANLKSRIPELENKNAALEAQIKELMREIEDLKRDHDMELNTLNEDLTNTRSELSQVLEELQTLLDAKLSLELEIVAYRKLLEGEEARSTESLKQQQHQMGNRMDLVLPPKPKVTENSISKVNNNTVEASITSKSENSFRAEVKATDEDPEEGTDRSIPAPILSREPGILPDPSAPPTGKKSESDGEKPRPSPKEDNLGKFRDRVNSNGSTGSVGSSGTGSSLPTMSRPLKKPGRQVNAGGGELTARTSFQRTAKGNVSIKESVADGSRIVIENTGSKKQDISGWTVRRDVDNSRQIVSFKLPSNTVLESDGSKKVLSIWAKGLKPKGSADLECNDTNWGVGRQQVITTIVNEKGEERATHTAKTTYS